MSIHGVEIQKACEGDPEHVRDVVVGYLIKLG